MSSKHQPKQPERVLGPGAVGDPQEPDLAPEPHLISDEVMGTAEDHK